MKDETKQLIKSTWTMVIPIADTAAACFYDRLFEIDPGLQPLFAATDMKSQRKKLIQALATVVNALDDIDAVLPRIEALGRSHAHYGVEDRHYISVGSALIQTLEQGLGEAWNDRVRDAWIEAYGLVSSVMKNAGSEVNIVNRQWPQAMAAS